jgi:hypothetical protein
MLVKDLGTWHIRGWSYDKDYFRRAVKASSFKVTFKQFVEGTYYLEDESPSHRENWTRLDTIMLTLKSGFKHKYYIMKKEDLLALSKGIEWEGFGKMSNCREIW